LLNALYPFGNGFLLPAGTLREPPSALQRAQAVVITHADAIDAEGIQAISEIVHVANPGVPIATAVHKPTALYDSRADVNHDPAWLHGKEVVAFCGIGFSDGFTRTLEELGVTLVHCEKYGDHQEYSFEEVEKLEIISRQLSDAIIVTTEKDYLRNEALLRDELGVLVLKIKIDICEGEAELDHVISSVLDN